MARNCESEQDKKVRNLSGYHHESGECVAMPIYKPCEQEQGGDMVAENIDNPEIGDLKRGD